MPTITKASLGGHRLYKKRNTHSRLCSVHKEKKVLYINVMQSSELRQCLPRTRADLIASPAWSSPGSMITGAAKPHFHQSGSEVKIFNI